MTAQIKSETVLALTRHVLIENAGVQALVKARVRTEHVTDAQRAQQLDYPLVILELEGGVSRGAGALQHARLRVWAYDRDSGSNASTIYDAVFAALHMQRLANPNETAAGSAHEIQRPMNGWNDKALAHYSSGLWRITLGA